MLHKNPESPWTGRFAVTEEYEIGGFAIAVKTAAVTLA